MSVERRLRIFQPDINNVHESKSIPASNNNFSFFKMNSLSSSKAALSGYSSSSATIVEEIWTQSITLTSINVLRITSASFDHLPFLDPSYGKDVSKLSFGGPCSPKAIAKALETFPAIDTLEFGSGFFIHEDFDRTEMLNVPQTKEFPGIESLTVNVDAKKYFKLKESQKTQMNCRIMFCLNIAGFQHLSHCSLSLPNAPHFDLEFLNYILIGIDLANGKKWTERENKQIRYEASSPSTPHLTNTVSSSRKRKAPSSPEVEITAVVSKEDKIQHVTISTSDEEDDDDQLNIQSSESHSNIRQPMTSSSDDDEIQEQLETPSCLLERHSDIIPNTPVPPRPPPPPSAPSTPSQLQDTAANNREQVIACLSSSSWRELNKGIWDSFDCTSIRIGDYKLTCCYSVAGTATTTRLVFSDRGIYFQFPHFNDDERKSINIGIAIEDITQVKVYNNDSGDSTFPSVFLKTTESCSVIRDILGMTNEESKGHYSPKSKYACQQYIQFRTAQTQPNNSMTCSRIRWHFFKHLFRRLNLLQELKSSSDLQDLQEETFCTH